MKKKDQRVIKESPTGYLVSSIRDHFVSLPKGFQSTSQQAERKRVEDERLIAAKQKRGEEEEQKRRREEVTAKVQAYWDGLSAAEREALVAEGMATVRPETIMVLGVTKGEKGWRGQPGWQDRSIFRVMVRDPLIKLKLGLPIEED